MAKHGHEPDAIPVANDYLEIFFDWWVHLYIEVGALSPAAQLAFLVMFIGAVVAFVNYFTNRWPFNRTSNESSNVNGDIQITPGKLLDHMNASSPEEAEAMQKVMKQFARANVDSGEDSEVNNNALLHAGEGNRGEFQNILKIRYQTAAIENASTAKMKADAARNYAIMLLPDDKAKALALFEEVVELEPDDFWSWLFLGQAQVDSAGLELANKSFEKCLLVAERQDDNRLISIAKNSLADVAIAGGDLFRGMKLTRRFIKS